MPFTAEDSISSPGGRVLVSVEYPVKIYVTYVLFGGYEVSVEGGHYLAFSGRTADLLAGLDFAELGLTGVVAIQAVDAGAPRSDWIAQVLYGDILVA